MGYAAHCLGCCIAFCYNASLAEGWYLVFKKEGNTRSSTWVRNVGPRCLGKKKNYQNLSGSCNKTHTKKESE